jgi:hypothetical protein
VIDPFGGRLLRGQHIHPEKNIRVAVLLEQSSRYLIRSLGEQWRSQCKDGDLGAGNWPGPGVIEVRIDNSHRNQDIASIPDITKDRVLNFFKSTFLASSIINPGARVPLWTELR